MTITTNTNSTFFPHMKFSKKRKINNKELKRIELKARYETYTQWMGRHNPTITEEL